MYCIQSSQFKLILNTGMSSPVIQKQKPQQQPTEAKQPKKVKRSEFLRAYEVDNGTQRFFELYEEEQAKAWLFEMWEDNKGSQGDRLVPEDYYIEKCSTETNDEATKIWSLSDEYIVGRNNERVMTELQAGAIGPIISADEIQAVLIYLSSNDLELIIRKATTEED